MDDASDPAAGPEGVEGGGDINIGSSGEEEEDEAPDVSPPPGDEDEEPVGVDEPNETKDEGPPSDDATMAEEALEVIEEIANVEGETPEEILDELEEEAEDLEYFEEAIDEMGDDLIAVEEEIAEEMAAEVDEIDVPEDLSGKGMISTDATAYDVPGTVAVSFEIDPFLPFDWVGLYPFDAAYHDYETDTLRVPHPSVEWLYLCGSQDCDGSVYDGESSLEFGEVEQGKWKVYLLRDSWGQSGSAAITYMVIAESEAFVVGDVDEENFGSSESTGGSFLPYVSDGQLSNTTVAGITALVCIAVFLLIGWKVSKRQSTRGHAVPSVELAEQGEWT
jgi:hypothetical protein